MTNNPNDFHEPPTKHASDAWTSEIQRWSHGSRPKTSGNLAAKVRVKIERRRQRRKMMASVSIAVLLLSISLPYFLHNSMPWSPKSSAAKPNDDLVIAEPAQQFQAPPTQAEFDELMRSVTFTSDQAVLARADAEMEQCRLLMDEMQATLDRLSLRAGVAEERIRIKTEWIAGQY